MNPFDWYGPQFLLFYAMLTLFMLAIVRWVRRSGELRPASDARAMKQGLVLGHTHPGFTQAAFTDPYLIAYLRGGTNEAVRTAVVALVDRGLLTISNDKITTSPVGLETEVRKPIEKEILWRCNVGADARSLFRDSKVQAACEDYKQQLAAQHLLPDERIDSDRRWLFMGATAVLLATTVLKLWLALARGRSNVLFLIIFTIIAVIVTRAVAFPQRTASGDVFLGEIQNLFSALKLRAAQVRPGGATAELSLLVAVFGVSALDKTSFAWTKHLFPPADSGSSNSGSSCGSSCGGGCGGGCGGCGG